MTIVIDGSSLQTEYRRRGIGRYTRNLVEALKKLGTDHKIILTSRGNEEMANKMKEYSRLKYGRDRQDVEEEILKRLRE